MYVDAYQLSQPIDQQYSLAKYHKKTKVVHVISGPPSSWVLINRSRNSLVIVAIVNMHKTWRLPLAAPKGDAPCTRHFDGIEPERPLSHKQRMKSFQCGHIFKWVSSAHSHKDGSYSRCVGGIDSSFVAGNKKGPKSLVRKAFNHDGHHWQSSSFVRNAQSR